MLNYCVVKQRIGAIAEDDPDDDDRYPDYRRVSGDISFNPILTPGRSYQILDSEGVFHTAPALRINAKIVNGEITHEGETGVHLFAAGPNSNPPTIAYNVIYSNLTAGGIPVTLGNISFVVIPGATFDLATATPIAGTPGVGITKGDKGEPGEVSRLELTQAVARGSIAWNYFGTGTPVLSDFPNLKVGDTIVRKSDGLEWRVDP